MGDGGKWGPPGMPRSCRLPMEAVEGVALSTAPLHFPLLSFIWVWSDVSGHKGSADPAPAGRQEQLDTELSSES